VLLAGYGCLALTITAIAVAMAAQCPPLLVFALAPLTTLSLSAPRPAVAAVLPALVATPEQLTAANVMEGWAETLGGVGGPVVAALLTSWHGPALAMAVSALVTVAALAVTAAGLRRSPLLRGAGAGRARVTSVEPAARGAAAPAAGPGRAGVPGGDATGGDATGGARRNLVLLRQSPATLLLLGLHGFYYLVIGATEIVCVVLAAGMLHLGVAATGYLTACLGAGGVLAAGASIALVGRRRLAGVVVRSIGLVVVALAALGTRAGVGDAFLLVAAVGLGGSLADVAVKLLLLRVARSDSIAGAFSFLEAVMNLGLAAGALAARALVAWDGARGALYGLSALGLVTLVTAWRPLRAVDATAAVPQVEVRLLRAVPIFGSLPAPELEGVARQLVRCEIPAGTVVVSQGERGDRWYVVADGRLGVVRDDAPVASLGRGDSFGEIALVRDVPRTATVVAETDALLYSLDEAAFLLVLSGYSPARSAAERLAEDRLPGEGAARGAQR
jgi:hypothetical protein